MDGLVSGDDDQVTTSDDDDISSPDRISSLGGRDNGKRQKDKGDKHSRNKQRRMRSEESEFLVPPLSLFPLSCFYM